jgi:hypothetical protein
MATTNRGVAFFVDRATPQWMARDLEGKYWSLPSTENPGGERQPFTPAEETKLEPVPGHYKDMLALSA